MADASKVLATRNMRPYVADYETDIDLPDNDVDYGVEWESPWQGPFYTDGGFSAGISIDRAEVTVDQEIWPVLRPITGGSITFGTELAEFDVANIQLAAGVGEVQTDAPGSGSKGADDFVIHSEFTENFISLGFEAQQQNGEPVRGIVYKGIPTGSPEMQFGQADQKAMVQFEVQAVPADADADHPVALIRRVLPETGNGNGGGGEG